MRVNTNNNNEREHVTFGPHTRRRYRPYLSSEVKHDELRRVEPGLGVTVALAQVGVVVKLQTEKQRNIVS